MTKRKKLLAGIILGIAMFASPGFAQEQCSVEKTACDLLAELEAVWGTTVIVGDPQSPEECENLVAVTINEGGS